MKKLTLEFLRYGDHDAHLKKHPEDAVKLALLKWSKENRGFLFAENEHNAFCALCTRYRTYDTKGKAHCNDCPLKHCDSKIMDDMTEARDSFDYEKYNKLADEYLAFLREKLEAQNE